MSRMLHRFQGTSGLFAGLFAGLFWGLAPALILAPLLLVALPLQASDAPAPTGPRPVVSEIVTADPTRQRAFPGVIEAAHETDLAFQTIGRIALLDVSPGDIVQQGAVLATLDRVTLREDLRAAEAALTSARARADYAEQSYGRVRALQDRDIATTEQVEGATADRNAARAQVTAAEADLAAAQEALSYATLRAPSDGIVLATPVKQGTVVASGTTVVTLADLAGREAVIDVPSEFMSLLPPDARFELVGQDDTADPVSARLRLIEPVADDQIRGRRLRLSIAAAPAQFRIGSLVTASYAESGTPVMTLPQSALRPQGEGHVVWRVQGQGATRVVHGVPVTPGASVGDRVVVTDGISVGDEIVVKGAQSLADGQQVGERVQ